MEGNQSIYYGNFQLQTFKPEQRKEYKEFFEKYGFVVVEDVISPEDCKNSIEEIWEIIQHEGALREDPKTWDLWPPLGRLGQFFSTF